MIASVVYFGTVAFLAAALFSAAWRDVRELRIPNKLVLSILLVFPLHDVAAHAGGAAVAPSFGHLTTFAGMFVVGLVIFQFRFMGGGDVKLLTVLALWSGPTHLAPMLVLIALAGGALALVTLVLGRFGWSFTPAHDSGGAAATTKVSPPASQTAMPYGVAIAIGGLYLVFQLIFNGLAG